MKIFLGTNMDDNENSDFVYKVKRTIPHPEYSRWENQSEFSRTEGLPLTYNDIALIELDKDIKFGPNVKALEIAPHGFDAMKYSDKSVGIGWGITQYMMEPKHLQKFNQILRSDEDCYGVGSPDPQMKDYKDQLLCGGGILKDKWSPIAGEGNSGGPAICRGPNGTPLLCGVTSTGADDKPCQDNDDEKTCPPSAYADVSYFRDWIMEIAGRQDPSTFHKPYLYGKRVQRGEYPHQVHITSFDGPSCGGTLIAPNYVVTAGHCIMKSPGMTYGGIVITAGITDLKSKGTAYSIAAPAGLPTTKRVGTPVDVKAQGNHVIFSENYFTDDIIVLKLNDSVDISPSQLPRIPDNNYPEFGTELALPLKTEPYTEMRSRDFRFVDKADCQARMDRLKVIGHDIKVDDSLLCGVEVYSGGSTCDRELGGGVICKGKDGMDELCGVQVYRLCEYSIPNGFFNVATLKGWFTQVMEALK